MNTIVVRLAVAIFVFWSSGVALAASASDALDAARKEGQVVVYGAGEVDSWQKLNDAFEKKYPGIKVSLFRGNWERVRNRLTTEARAGAYLVDVLQIDGINGWVLKEQGYFQPHKSRETDAFPEEFRDPSGLLPCCQNVQTNVIGYNTRFVTKQDAPKSYRDLLDPKWKNNLGMDADEGEWFAGLISIWGKERTADFFRGIARQNPSLRRGHTLVANLTAAGEFPVAVNLFGYRVAELQAAGAAMELVNADPVVTRPSHLALVRRAPHVNAGRLYMDFIFSVEGQQVLANTGRIMVRPGIKNKYPKLTDSIKLHPVKPEMAKDYEEVSKLYYSIMK